MKRRQFIQHSTYGAAFIATPWIISSCNSKESSTDAEGSSETPTNMKPLKISLAQWSLHRAIEEKTLNPVDFASIANDTYGIEAVEYVNQFYADHAEDETFWQDMKTRAGEAGVTSLLIMVDNEGDLGGEDDQERMQAVENHYKWVNAAKLLGCHSIRVNAFGAEDKEVFRNALIDGGGRVAEYAASEGINVLIENHGLYSADADLITDVIKEVNRSNFGTFPDFGNWCMSAKWGSTMGACEEAYDIYEGVKTFLPYAKAVSAKAYNFDENGNQTKIDYDKMLNIVKESQYDGYIGIEYEGENLSEHEGILATKALMERVWGP